jgi:hypothetical protein
MERLLQWVYEGILCYEKEYSSYLKAHFDMNWNFYGSDFHSYVKWIILGCCFDRIILNGIIKQDGLWCFTSEMLWWNEWWLRRVTPQLFKFVTFVFANKKIVLLDYSLFVPPCTYTVNSCEWFMLPSMSSVSNCLKLCAFIFGNP